MMIFSALTIAGSDPSGGAGVQSDLRTFSSFGVHGLSVIASLTAQNTEAVTGRMDVPADFVAQQLDAVTSDFTIHAAKTGMLGNASIVEVIAERLCSRNIKNLVVDPVMVSSSGATLLDSAAVEVFKSRLIPLALLMTPNLQEAQILAETEVRDASGMEHAARRIGEMGARFVLVKGGHLTGDPVDVLFDGSRFRYLRAARIGTGEVHGTGCLLSAAIAACLARGDSVDEAVDKGKDWVTRAIAGASKVGHGSRLIYP